MSKASIFGPVHKFRITVGPTFTLLDQKLKFKTSILMFGKRNLDYKLKIKRIKFYLILLYQKC